MAVFLNRNKRPKAAPIEVAELLSEKPPLPQNLQHLPRNLQFQEKKGTMELFIWHHLFQTVDEEVLQWSSTCS